MDPRKNTQGPFRASSIRDGDRYELSSGHAVYCAPAGRDHAAGSLQGGNVLGTDPDVEWAGLDAGFSPRPGDLRAPDVAVGAPAADVSGWIKGVPQLAVEYAGVGQDEGELGRKIADLLAAGTRLIWVVRLIGPQRVEVHEADKPPRTSSLGDLLEAPGILRNPVPVRALFDRGAGFEAMLRNLLQRQGYEDLDSVLNEGAQRGIERMLRALLAKRFGALPEWAQARLRAADTDTLERWSPRLLDAASLEDVFD